VGKQRLKLARIALGIALAVVTACAEPEIDEQLRCALSADGTAEVSFEVSFPDLNEEADSARRERVDELRQFYFEGWDPWAARFERAGQGGETLSWERLGGRLQSLTRTAHFEDPEALSDFFADTDVAVLFTPDPEESEFAVFAGQSSRATGEERERLEGSLAGWSQAAVVYLNEVANLYVYLDAHEDRAEVIFEAIFDDSSEGLHDFEEERLERLLEAFLAVLEIAEATDDQGDSLEHLARLVFDPFPAGMAVEVEGRVLDHEGFVVLPEGVYGVLPLGLERALSKLEERWIEPPLLTTYERLERLGDAAEFDAGEFAQRSRRIARLPTAKEFAEAVEEALAPASEYRLRWRPNAASRDSDD